MSALFDECLNSKPRTSISTPQFFASRVRTLFFVLLIVSVVSLELLSNRAFGQSAVIAMPATAASKTADPVPNGMSAKQRQWEAILDQPFTNQFADQTTVRDFIGRLNRIGLPIAISQSARDDSLNDDDTIQLPAHKASLRSRLLVALEVYNSTIVFQEDHIDIISLDDSEDYLYFMVISYDVSNLGADPFELLASIQTSVQNESWLDYGTGLGGAVLTEVNGKDLITISQTYSVHREVQNMLAGLSQLGGNQIKNSRRNVSNHRRPRRARQSGMSQVVTVPSEDIEPRVPHNEYLGGVF